MKIPLPQQAEQNSNNRSLIAVTPFSVQTAEFDDLYTFDDVLAMRFGIEHGTQLLVNGRASQLQLEFKEEPLRLTHDDSSYPMSVV